MYQTSLSVLLINGFEHIPVRQITGASGKMTIGKSSLKKVMTTYAQKWKRSEIYKRKSAGGLQAEKKKMIVGPHHPKANIIVFLIHQYYQQIIR